jgi:two-component system, NtrC family, response regulator AtoC
MSDARRILVVDDDVDVLLGIVTLLAHTGWNVESAGSGREALRKFDAFDPEVVLLDVMLPDLSGLEILDQIKSVSEHTPIVMMSGVGTIDAAVTAMRLGAANFLPKPCDFDNLELVLEQVTRQVRRDREIAALRRGEKRNEDRLVGVSPAIGKVNEWIDRVAASSSPVLLLGESGTGKGVVARLIHNRSPRASGPFVDLNCAGLSTTLLESELFGHERGAFTDASTSKPGLFEVASGGTIFLDEIGELDLGSQARLLKALEDKKFRRVGGARDINADFRLLAATNRSLAGEVEQGRFRKDLYYRLNVVTLEIPPLRERADDIEFLAQVILERLQKEIGGRKPISISSRALAALQAYLWPGNVRELRNVLERALLLGKGEEIRVEDLALDSKQASRPVAASSSGREEVRPLDDVIRETVKNAVALCDGNIREAARRLGISPSTLYSKLK